MKLVIRGNVESGALTSASESSEYLVMKTEDSIYALPIAHVEHVLSARYSQIERVQAAYEALVGFVHWQGEQVPVLDLHSHLTAVASTSEESTGEPNALRLRQGSVVLTKHSDGVCGLLVDLTTRFTRIARGTLNGFPLWSLDSRRKVYQATAVIDEGVAVVLGRHGLFPRSVREFLMTATSDFSGADGETSQE